MTPAEIRDLADAVEAGTANYLMVWRALGAEKRAAGYDYGLWEQHYYYYAFDGSVLGDAPPHITTDLNALAAECARRGWNWSKTWGLDGWTLNVLFKSEWAVESGQTDCTAKSDAAALCAALLRAVAAEKEATDD